MKRRHAVLLFAVFAALVAVNLGLARPPRSGPAARPAATHPSRPRSTTGPGGARVSPYWRAERRVVRLQHALGRANAARRSLRRALLHRPSSLEALRLASVAYQVPFDLLYRRASCESMGSAPANPPSERTLNAYAANPSSSARGLMQFLTTPNGGTWATTPYAGFSVYSPYASAFAGAWMQAHGRGGEWVCQ